MRGRLGNVSKGAGIVRGNLMGQAVQDGADIIKRFIVVDGDRFRGQMSKASDAETINIARTLLGAYKLPQVEIDDRDDARYVIAILMTISNCGKTMRKRLLMHVAICLAMVGWLVYHAITNSTPIATIAIPIVAIVAFAIVGMHVLMSPFNDMIGRFGESITCLSDSGTYHVGHDNGVLAEVSYIVHSTDEHTDGKVADDVSVPKSAAEDADEHGERQDI